MRQSQRKLIREKVKDTLFDKTNCGVKVFANRFTPVWEEELPMIIVYTMDEPSSVWAEAPREMERRLRLAVEIIGRGREDENGNNIESVDDVLDVVAQQVEDALALDHTLGEICRDVILTNTEMMVDPSGDKNIASLRLTYEIPYYTVEVAIDKDTDLKDLKTVGNTYRVFDPTDVGMDNVDSAKDQIDLAQR